jgi:hypothetical protein
VLAPNQVCEAGGELDLTLIAKAEKCGGTTEPYASGIVTTNGRFSFTYGFDEARVWLPAAAGGQVANWPAIWGDRTGPPTVSSTSSKASARRCASTACASGSTDEDRHTCRSPA